MLKRILLTIIIWVLGVGLLLTTAYVLPNEPTLISIIVMFLGLHVGKIVGGLMHYLWP